MRLRSFSAYGTISDVDIHGYGYALWLNGITTYRPPSVGSMAFRTSNGHVYNSGSPHAATIRITLGSCIRITPSGPRLVDNLWHALYAPIVSALDKVHAKHALPGFTDRTAEERDIERMTTDITKVRLVSSYPPRLPHLPVPPILPPFSRAEHARDTPRRIL